MLKIPAAACLFAAALAVPGCAIDVQGEGAVLNEERRFPADDGVELVLRTFDGSIDVESWDADEVVVRIERGGADGAEAEALEVRAEHQGNRILIEAPQPESGDVVRVGPGRSVAYFVRTPRRTTLDAQTGDGAIDAVALEGDVTLNTGDGSVRADRITGRIRVRTGDGAVSVRDADGTVDAGSGDGSIDVSGRLESVLVRSGDGAVDVDARDGSVAKDDWSITTGDGAIRLALPSALNALVEADSADGGVRANWEGEDLPPEDGERRSFRGRLGAGGPVIRLRSGDGAIDISRR